MLDNIMRGARSWAVKIIFGIIILVFIFWGMGNFNTTPAHTAAKVNGENISLTSVMHLAEANLDAFRRNVPDYASNKEAQQAYKMAVLQEVVQKTLRRQEAERLGLFVPHVEVSMTVASIPQFQNAQGKFDDARYKDFLKRRGMTQAQFQEDVRLNLLDEKLMTMVVSGVSVSEVEAKASFDFGLARRTAQYVLFPSSDYVAKAEVSDQEVAAWYETNKDTLRLPARIDLDYIELTPASLAGNMKADDEEIAKYYADHTAEFTEPAGYTSKQILLRLPPAGTPGYDTALGNARARMGEIQEKLAAGEDFGALARQYSDDPLSRAVGGEMGFMTEGSLPEDLDRAAFALKPGEVSAPVQTPFGLHLIKLEDKRSVQQKPLDGVREQIRQKIALEKALNTIPDLQAKAEEALRLGTAFDKIAAELNSPVKNTGLLPRTTVTTMLKLHKDSVTALSGVPTGRAAPAPLSVADGVVLVFVKDSKPEEIPPLEAVKAEITDTLKRGRADSLAHEAAQKALADFSGTEVPAAYKDLVKVSRDYSVPDSSVRPMTGSEALAEALMSAPQGTWLPKVYKVTEGSVIARQISSTPPTAEEWASLKDMFMQNYLQRKRQDVAVAFMQNLLDKADTALYPEALETISLR